MARTPSRGEPLTRIVAFRLSESEYAELQRAANACSLSVPQFLCEAANEAVGDTGGRPVFRVRTCVNTPAVTAN